MANSNGSIIEMRVPTVGESVKEVTLSRWLIADGASVQLDQPICEFESDKATLEFPAEATGKLIHIAKEGDDLSIGALVAKIEVGASASIPNVAPATTPTPIAATPSPIATTPVPTAVTGHPSPAAAKIMRETGLASDQITGTGKEGRITKEDANNAATSQKPAPVEKPIVASTPTPAPAPSPKQEKIPTSPAVAFSRNIRKEKMSRMRRTIAKRLVSATQNTAMLTTFNEVDLTEINALRKKYQDRFVEKYGIKLGFMSLFAKACAKVLMEMPEVNAQIEEDNLIYHDFVDISIAISTPTGLVVPPVHNVESLKLHEIEWKIKGLADKAKEGTLTLEEMTGGTFAITNGGVFGSLLSTPILNEPQSAILGMHGIQDRAVVINGEIKIRPMMYIALSYDHRVIDGKSSVTFLVKVKHLLEDPTALLLDL